MKSTCFAVLLAVLSSTTLYAQACAGPLDLGTLLGGSEAAAWGVSADGAVVVGYSSTSAGQERAFLWTAAATGMQDLGTLGGDFSSAYGVSADGTVVVGESRLGNNELHAFRWTAVTGMQDLGTLGGNPSGAYGVSADGTVVVGESRLGNNEPRAFRWTAATGMQDLGTLGGIYSRATGVSADGTVVVGLADLPGGPGHAFRWTAATGMQDLGTPGSGSSEATAVNGDGSVVVGRFTGPLGGARAFRWTAVTGMQDLGTLGAPTSWQGWAFGVSSDGAVVVGGPGGAFRWTAQTGMQSVILLNGGAASDVSDDGTVAVGWGYSFTGGSRALRSQTSIMGSTYCRPTVANSTGCGGTVLARGNPLLFFGSLELTATLLPQGSFGFFLASRTQGFSSGIPNNQGNICLAGSIGRFVAPGQVMNSGTSGTFTLNVDLNALPTPTGLVAAMPGETWHFQAWHRDANPTLTSNFTDAVSITFN